MNRAFKDGQWLADSWGVHSLSVFLGRRPLAWRLLGPAGLSAVLLWALTQAPAARPAEVVAPRPAAAVDENKAVAR
ncbi:MULTISPECIES: hypothetical protein [Streptomyces]|uniref:hypothetical protein n=1 Tax=Streptomyces TaxID=1883 RepID=UPI00188D48B5|nr:hypothetical protein [Streptomyces sp. MBT70]MBK3523877.1 hypothetical protein [Streptomyces sp. MBT70]GGS10258.1 hypothetical protein GCM10010236_75940 [Streptomyces eurythermus]